MIEIVFKKIIDWIWSFFFPPKPNPIPIPTPTPDPTPIVQLQWTEIPGLTVGSYREHESCHEANKRAENLHGGWDKVVAMWDSDQGKAIIIPEIPGLTLSDVAKAVPTSQRGEVYNLYMVQQARDWNNCPLYECDELSAYTNGTTYYKQKGQFTQAAYSLERAKEILNYAKVALNLSASKSYDSTQLKLALQHWEQKIQSLK